MNIIVIGCGRVGAELAYSLFQKGHKVAVVDQVASAFNNLHPEFRGRTIEGEASHQDVLERAGIETAEGLAAVTNSDTLNTVVARVAQMVYDVPNIVVRNYDPRWRDLHETLGFQVVSSSSWGAQRIEEMLAYPDLHTVYSAGNGEVDICEFAIPTTWDGVRLGELLPTDNCAPVSLTRAGKASIPDRETIIHENDVILVSATLDGIQSLRDRLASRPEA